MKYAAELFGPSRRFSPPRESSTVRYQPPPSSSVRLLGIDEVDDVPAKSSVLMSSRELFAVGDVSLLHMRNRVAIVGAREATSEGQRRAARLARELAGMGAVVVSGLAKGIDTAAHAAAIAGGGRTIAVIGTPVQRCYPAENADLQRVVWQEHLLISQFAEHDRTFPSSFVTRNKLMAVVAQATVVIEAGDTSGSLHQAAECQRIGRPLFIAQSVLDNPLLTWPARFVGHPGVFVLRDTRQILDAILTPRSP